MITRYVPALNGVSFLGMIAHEGTSDSHYVRATDYDKLQAEVMAMRLDMERYARISTEQQVKIESLRNLLRSVGFGDIE